MRSAWNNSANTSIACVRIVRHEYVALVLMRHETLLRAHDEVNALAQRDDPHNMLKCVLTAPAVAPVLTKWPRNLRRKLAHLRGVARAANVCMRNSTRTGCYNVRVL